MEQPKDTWIDTDIHNNKWTKHPLTAIGLIGICYLAWKIVALQGEDLTFKYIWFSGSLWLDGQSPYGPEYMEMGHKLFTGFNGQPFYYPPNWWAISTFFASFDYITAMEIWRVLNGIFILSGTVILNNALRHLGIKLNIGHLIFYTGLISIMQITPVILTTGQTSLLIYLGLCLLINGILADRKWVLTLALCIIVLKPQIGVPLMAALLAFRQHHFALLRASVITIILTIPALISGGPVATITLFLKGLSKHSGFITNSPENSTGLKNILINIFNIEASSTLLTTLSIFMLFIIAMYVKRRTGWGNETLNSRKRIILMIVSLVAVGFIAPLHEYDMIMIAPVLLLTCKFDFRFQNIITLIFMLMMRPGNIANILNIHDVDQERAFIAIIMTTALTFMLVFVFIQSMRIKDYR